MSIQQKQSYLREAIMEKGINPVEFFQYWQDLNQQLEDVQFDKLKQVVSQFFEKYSKEHANQGDEEQFTDFQEAQVKQAKNQYSNFNWDFLAKHHTEATANQVKKEPVTIRKNEPQEKAERKKNQPSLSQQRQKRRNKQKMRETAGGNLIDELNDNEPRVNPQPNISLNPKQQKTLTVQEVLQTSKLNTIQCLKLQQNVLSHHSNVEIYITNVEEIEDKATNIINKFMKNSYLLFTIKTVARNKNRSVGISWEVKRKWQDFQWLRNSLVKFYPGLVVPPLPVYPKSKNKIFGCQKKLQNFLLDCYRCPQLKNSKYYEVFLSYSNSADFQLFAKNSENNSKPKVLNHILNMTGVVQTLYSKSIEQYGAGLQGYLNKTSQHLKQVKSILTEINEAYDQISYSYKQLANVFFQMSDESHSFSDEKCYERLANTYKQIGILAGEHSNFCQGEKQFIDAFMQSHFAYQKDRLDNMQSLISKRIVFANQLEKRPKQQEKKSSMFGKIANFFGQKSQFVDTPSSNYETLKNQVGYYNNQLLRESIRCVEVMIESHINHFSGYGHTRIDNVDKMQKIWSNILVQLSRLNAK